jgi:hypothetical protein
MSVSGTIRAMSYDLAVWEGDRPASDAAAGKYYREHLVPQLAACDPADPG